MIKMMLAACLCLAAMPLAGCGPRLDHPVSAGTVASPAPVPRSPADSTDALANATVTIDKVDASYRAAEAAIAPFRSFMPSFVLDRLVPIERAIEAAIGASRAAVTVADQVAAIEQAKRAIAQLKLASGT